MSNNVRPAVLTAQMYGTKVSVEYDHSDISLDETMDAFETLVTGLGYHKDAWKQWIIERAEEYKEEDTQSENDIEDEEDYIVNADWAVVDVINKLKQIEVDGEIMQYILEEVGLDEQMAIQLATRYPDVVEEHLAELKDEREPNVSDDFQIGPDGAYEYEEDDDTAFMNAFQEDIKSMKNNNKNGK